MPIPKGTRDFGPTETLRRQYILDTITSVFKAFAFLPIETPAMENLETLTGKYGEEGDQLIFKILNNGDYLKEVKDEALNNRDLSAITRKITEKALRYDLTVPFARFVAEHRHEITFPFRRYQIQNVWRADRPQKGRYREFTQCDADIIGTNSLVSEIELIQIFDQVFSKLGLKVVIKINNRKILTGLAESIGRLDKFNDLTIAIDKLDKVGLDGVTKELNTRGFSETEIVAVSKFLSNKDAGLETLLLENPELLNSADFNLGKAELDTIFKAFNPQSLSGFTALEFDPTLARGLNYYTGAIFEVKANEGSLTSSICGGGRYDNLTGIFGLQGVSGVGISFGADRIYDVLQELNKFPNTSNQSTQALIINFAGLGTPEFADNFKLLSSLREAGIPAEIYPDASKLRKQFEYADKKQIPFVVIMGADEIAEGKVTLKNMKTSEQEKLDIQSLIGKLQVNGGEG